MTADILSSDRGYNCEQTIKYINKCIGATGLGTQKRSYDFSFVFGDGGIRKRQNGIAIIERGCRALYSVERKPKTATGREVEACVYRKSFSGRIAKMHHNNHRMFFSNGFNLILKNKFNRAMNAADSVVQWILR